MLSCQRLAVACLALAALIPTAQASSSDAPAPAPAAAKKQIVYEFERASAAGIEGAIRTQHNSGGDSSQAAWILASLDFSALDIVAVRKSDPQCKDLAKIREFQYHIHVDWNASPRSKTSDSFAGCAKPITGNHYDPYKICGPASEYVDTPACAPKIKDYKCTPDEYKKNFAACESGDLSGKFGSFKPDKNSAVKAEWYDPRFPFFSEVTTKWNIVVHAVCGKATPRVACSSGSVSQKRLHMKSKKAKELEGDDVDDDVVDDDDEETTEMQVTDKLHLKFHRHHRAGN